MSVFQNADGKFVMMAMIKTIQDNKTCLSELDGKVGDGDHGMNMNKGFRLYGKQIADRDMVRLTEGLDDLGMVLMEEIGGSMGPIYGTVFTGMAEAGKTFDEIGTSDFAAMMEAGLSGLYEITEARVGDKTLVDTLAPACVAMTKAADEGKALEEALADMAKAAEAGKESTKELVARYGRSSRLGERSRGTLDAGAVSCNLLLQAMANSMQQAMRRRG